MEEMNNGYVNQSDTSQQDGSPKKTGNAVKFIIPAAVFIVLVLILTGVAAATGMFTDEKKAITEAVNNTFYESMDAVGKVWKTEEYRNIFSDGNYSVDMDFDIASFLQFEMEVNSGEEAYSAFVDIGYFGGSVLLADLYADDEQVLLSMPYVTDYVFYVDRKNLEEDVRELVRKGILDDETARYIRSLNEGSRNVDLGDEEFKQGVEEMAGIVREIFRSVEAQKAESGEFTVNGSRRKCKGYVVTLTGQHLADYFLGIKKVYEKNEAFRNYCNQAAATGAGFGSTEEFLEYYDPAEILEEYAEEIRQQKPIEIYLYIYKKTLAQVYVDFEDGSRLEWDIYGGNFPLENTEFTFSSAGEEILSLSRKGDKQEDAYRAEYELKMTELDMIAELEYDTAREDFEFKFGLDDGMYVTTFLMEGEIDRSKELMISIDNFEVDDEEILAGDIVIYKESGEITKPEGERLDILKMSEEEWDEIIQEIYDNM